MDTPLRMLGKSKVGPVYPDKNGVARNIYCASGRPGISSSTRRLVFSRLALVMIVYTGSVDDSHELIQFFRREVDKLRALKKVVISRERTVVKDVNGDEIEFPGLTYGRPALDDLLRDLGVV